MARTAHIVRETSESHIDLELNLDGTGKTDIDTSVPFYNHMMTALGKHSLIDLTIHAHGDTDIDVHHTVEDTATGSLVRHVMESIAFHAGICLHMQVLAGRDPHHIAEAEFKALARALRFAVEIDPRVDGVPSTKGAL